MESVRATKPFIKHPDDSGTYSFIFEDAINLPSGLTISSVGASEVRVESGTSVTALTVGSGSANSSTFVDDDGETVPIGKAVQASMSGGTTDVNYIVKFPVTLSNGRVVGGEFPVWIRR